MDEDAIFVSKDTLKRAISTIEWWLGQDVLQKEPPILAELKQTLDANLLPDELTEHFRWLADAQATIMEQLARERDQAAQNERKRCVDSLHLMASSAYLEGHEFAGNILRDAANDLKRLAERMHG